MSIEELRKNRARFLHRLYEVTGGSRFRRVKMHDIGMPLGFTRAETFNIAEYLRGEGLITYPGSPGLIEITHAGTVTAENALSAAPAQVGAEARHDIGETAPPPVERETAYCQAVTHDGHRSLSAEEYKQLISREPEFDMFIDGVTRKAHCRTGSDNMVQNELTPGEFEIICEYMLSKKIMAPHTTKTGGSRSWEAALKLFTRARAKVDARLDRRTYRAFRSHRSSDRTRQAFEFAPTVGMTFCLIVPVR